MNKQRILEEAQQLASKYSFWMVSGDISHLYGYVLETLDEKFGLEVKFPEKFPEEPPELDYHENTAKIMENIELNTLNSWNSKTNVIQVIDEIKEKLDAEITKNDSKKSIHQSQEISNSSDTEIDSEEYITPDLEKYPAEFDSQDYNTPSISGDELFYGEPSKKEDRYEKPHLEQNNENLPKGAITDPNELFIDTDIELDSVAIKTELALIQQEFAYDQKGESPAHLIIYLTITLTKTFLIEVDFMNYPKKPRFKFPEEVINIIKDPYQSLETLRTWKKRKAPHIIEVLRELEKQLLTVKELETQLRKISQEFIYKQDPQNLTKIEIPLLTYGFEEYSVYLDLEPLPEVPEINFSEKLNDLLRVDPEELGTIENWQEGTSEPLDIIREVSWLLDKSSRINFELELLQEQYQNIHYDPSSETLMLDMKGKMKTEDLTFNFKIQLPRDYPMNIPEISVLNEFEMESHEKIKQDLNQSFKEFFNEWTPYSYLVDLFNLISKKIFEVSATVCVICHKIECPVCSLKIAGSDEETCHISCPHCDRTYHKHCWEQTIQEFGKCGFCLRTPPANYIS